MRTNRIRVAAQLVVVLLWSVSLRGADDWVRYTAQPGGGKVEVDGTSTIHDWSVESRLIGGYVEFDPAFSLEQPKPGKVNARVAVLVSVRQLKSDKTKMDTVMYDAMKEKDHRRIDYRLTELTLKEAPKGPDGPFLFDSKGDLVVAGVTNKISMPVTMTRVDKDKLKFTGSTSVKMTSFGIQPPTLIGILSTGDDVKITFEWLTARKDLPAK
jgi:polyisoprenoid-binding protein YceI